MVQNKIIAVMGSPGEAEKPQPASSLRELSGEKRKT